MFIKNINVWIDVKCKLWISLRSILARYYFNHSNKNWCSIFIYISDLCASQYVHIGMIHNLKLWHKDWTIMKTCFNYWYKWTKINILVIKLF